MILLFFVNLLIVLTALVFTIRYFVLCRKNPQAANTTGHKVLIAILESLFLIVLPVAGFFISNDPCDAHPFELHSYPSAVLLYSVPLMCYFLSRYLHSRLAPLILALLPAGIVTGIVYCIALGVHFSSMLPAVVIPLVGLPLIAPYAALFFLLMEFLALHKRQYEKATALSQQDTTSFMKIIISFFYSSIWVKIPVLVILCAPLLALLQFILTLAGQAPDSLISMFTESCGFLLSNYSGCSCGGDHYLCSVAANGSTKLVKPSRTGWRKNERIVVNRQLLVANAFEHWLEDHTPELHRAVRKTYDACGIPVNKWSKHKNAANIIFILMKPLEWFFLLWLYCFDKAPETRIAKQYLPKDELKQFIAQHENNR